MKQHNKQQSNYRTKKLEHNDIDNTTADLTK